MNMKKIIVALGMASSFMLGAQAANAAAVDPSLPTYTKSSGVSGNFTSVGSDTLNNLMTLWAESYKRFYPNVNIQIQGAGSSTAPPALIQGASNFGPMSRVMKDEEIVAFEKKYGYKPTAVPVAIDALAVYVNKDNPIKGLSIAQVDAIFSATRKCGEKAEINKWGQLGMTGDWAGRKKHALCKGDFTKRVAEQPGSASVVQSVSGQIGAIGYSGIGYLTSGVRAVPLAKKDGEPFYEASPENALSKKYPLARVLYVYVNKRPNQALSPLEREFFGMVLSRQGQEVVVKDGFVPMPAAMVSKARRDLGID